MTRQASRLSISVRSRRDRPVTAFAARPDGQVPCEVCPRACKLQEGQEGLCFVCARREGRMVLTTYGRSSGYCIHPIEKKPLNHFLPEMPVLSFGTAACNLACKFCQNWDISKSHEIDTLTNEARPEAIREAAVRLGLPQAYTYNHPSSLLNCRRKPAHRAHKIELPPSSMRLGIHQSESSPRDKAMRKTVLVEALLSLSARPVSAVRVAPQRWITTMCAALLILGLGQVAGAAPGDLDPSFDADGLVLTHFGRIDDDSPGGRSDIGTSVVAQPDGKLVVAGSSDSFDTFEPGDFALARYNSDGSFDSSFGSGGRVLTDFGGFDFASTLIVQPDGKLVAGGLSFGATGNDVFALARYNQDGSLDATFGSGGRLLISSLSVPCCIGGNALVAEPDGKLVVTAISFDEEQNSVATLVRLNPDGSFDPSFGSGGVVANFTGEARLGSLGALVLQPDGKLVVAGSSSEVSDNGFTDSIFLARFNPNGTLDSTFGSDGRVFTEGPFFSGDLVRQPDGKLAAVGVSLSCCNDSGGFSFFTLVRYNSDGSLDASFGSGGRVVTDVGVEASNLVLDPDGKFVATGEFFVPGTGSVFALARFNSDGSLDASFGAGGRVVTDFSQRSEFFRSTPYALAVQPDGKLVAAGSSNVSGDEDFALARYLVTNERPERPPKCGGHRATMLGTPRNDTLRGTFFGRDVILGLGGNDTIRGLGGTDILCGGSGNDVLIGGDESDQLYGESGNDKLFGDQGLSAVDGDDDLYGGSGRDTLVGDDGNDLLSGEGGKDRLFGDRGDDALDGGGERDRCKDRFGRNSVDNCDSGAGRPPTEPPRDPPPEPCIGRFCPQ